jgi:hypothetical protein
LGTTLRVAEKLLVLKGHDFSRAENINKATELYRLPKNAIQKAL